MRQKTIVVLCMMMTVHLLGCATSKKVPLSVASSPTDALVSIHNSAQGGTASMLGIAGQTPLAKDFEFRAGKPVWLEFEKRGFAPKRMVVTPDSGKLNVALETVYNADGSPIEPYHLPSLNQLLVISPDFKIIQRSFSSETVAAGPSEAARQALIRGLRDYFAPTTKIVAVSPAEQPGRIKSLWRDVHTAMEMVDPIRLPYLAHPYLLETHSSRSAALELGRQYQAEAILCIFGKQNVETASMKAGKIGITTLGTVNSYASGYSRAMANGESFFLFNVYVPQSSEYATMKAILINCRNGEVVWANSSFWPPLSFDNAGVVDHVLSDLLATLKP